MRRLGAGALAATFAAGFGLIALVGVPAAAAPTVTVAQALPPADFGAPPSGEVPILFNDRHVYSRPDRLRQARVLAALVRGNSILVPLRSLFEQMGGTVSYDASTKAVDVSKPGADVRVTVGKPEVVINGETRPLDVPPELYRGTVLVPLRVLSEALGAYVAWLPDKRVVVVRYLPAPVPTASPAPTVAPPAPTAAPNPPPAPKPPAKTVYEKFVLGDYLFSPKTYNELSPGTSAPSFRIAGAAEFPLFNLPWMLEGDFRSFRFQHNANGTGICPNPVEPGCVTTIQIDPLSGNHLQTYVPAFSARNDDFEGRFALKVADPRIYIGIGYLFRNTNYEGGAFPSQQSGLGFGAEKLPDLDRSFSLYGSVYYYPIVTTNGNQNLGGGNTGQVQYRVLKYNVGGTVDFGKSPLFLDFGYLGDQGSDKQNASSNFTNNGPYAGLGVHF
ncbi:MAG: copper amine oxidase N-terminal domain-containing protein [Candidatus Baltobacteraceae bacterium]